MTSEWVHSLIAVAGTLGAVVISVVSQQRSARAQQDTAYQREQEQDAIRMVAEAMKVIDEHRTAMWTLEEYRHAHGHARDDHVARSKQTRAALSEPVLRLQMFIPSLDEAAQSAFDATCAMHGSRSLRDLKARRRTALAAAKKFKATAAAQFKAAGIGLALTYQTNRRSKSG